MLHKGYEVWIADSREEPLPEYQVEVEEDDSVITCYIPSTSGEQFSIRWKDHNGHMGNYANMKMFIDGMSVGNKLAKPGRAGKRLGMHTESASVYHPFQFTALQTTDDEEALWGAGVSEQLGTIELRVVPVHPQMRSDKFKPDAFAGVSRVHERSKKAGAHCVALGRAVPLPPGQRNRSPRTVKVHALDKHAPPFVTFRFRYRPADILQAQNIMPAPVLASAGGRDSYTGPNTRERKGKARAPPHHEPASQASARATSVVDKKPLKSELQDTRIRVEAGGDVIELSDDDEVPQRKPAVKRDPDRRRSNYDPNDVIDLTLE